MTVKTKFEIVDGVLTTMGEYLNFSTSKVDNQVKTDGPVNRFYKNQRIEYHTPCEHEGKRSCKLEL